MILFHLPPFLIEGRDLLGGQRGIAAHQIAAHQIEDAGAAVRVCEDLLGEQ